LLIFLTVDVTGFLPHGIWWLAGLVNEDLILNWTYVGFRIGQLVL